MSNNKNNLTKVLLKVGLLGIAIAIIFTGCAIKKGTINSYVEPTYNRGNVRTIAMFPMRNAKFAPSEARQLNKQLNQEMIKKNPNVKIVPPSKALRMINDSGLASEWANFVEDYYTSGVADKIVLSKISKALKVDAIFQGQLIKVYQRDGGGFGSPIKGLTRITLGFSIIETKTAKTIWEASADGILGTADSFGEAPPIKDAIDLAMKKVKTNIPLL